MCVQGGCQGPLVGPCCGKGGQAGARGSGGLGSGRGGTRWSDEPIDLAGLKAIDADLLLTLTDGAYDPADLDKRLHSLETSFTAAAAVRVIFPRIERLPGGAN